MKDNKSASLFQKEQVIESLKQSFVKLNPRMMIKNPIMFTVEVATVVMLLVTLYSIVNSSQGSFAYNIAVFIILFVTLLFANFAEAIAEARGKAQADSLRKTREETPAKKVEGNKIVTVSSSQLKKGDVFVCEAGDVIPSDGEIIEGLASIDESAITGESAPVIREAGGDKSSVTGGTKVLSDHIKVLVTTQPGESFLDKMIALVEGASRQKTPNEIALTILLAGFTLVGCRKCISTETSVVHVKVVDKYYQAAYITMFWNGKSMMPVSHPAIYKIMVEYDGANYNIYGSIVYDQYSNRIGEYVNGILETKKYDDGSIKRDILNLE